MVNSKTFRSCVSGIACCMLLFGTTHCGAQVLEIRTGEAVPREVREMYDAGLQHLIDSQDQQGSWNSSYRGAGVDGMAVMCFLASGEDPNFGAYAAPMRKTLRNMLRQQSRRTGFFGGSMYHHGFAMLAVAEAYGTVDDRNLWPGESESEQITLAESLELAVRCAVTSQKKNSYGAWRYNPSGNDADTSVSGSVLVGLLAARNAGIEVPDEAIDRAIKYFVSMTSPSGQVAYAGGMGGFDESMARISIAALVYAVARRKDLPQYKQTLEYLKSRLVSGGRAGLGSVEYQNYYQAQALFQGDEESWKKWNQKLIDTLKTRQQPDGSFDGSYGKSVSTCLSLLALALNYRFLPIYER
ncbi:hypothetical protein Mal65_39780 [Crateriforma conspicua]|nr:hypothetical protein Mal65_39780 [Crateriforma conspicua]